MITESELSYRIRTIRPSFFGGGADASVKHIIDMWRLPNKRVLFTREDRHEMTEGVVRTPNYYLFVVSLARDGLVPTQVGDTAGYKDDEQATVAAIEWMQGLRADDLSGYDAEMITWLGEMAYRMSPDQLAAFTEQYFSVPYGAWGQRDNPNSAPGVHLASVLSDMGFTDDFLDMHL